MARTNTPVRRRPAPRTHEGAVAHRTSAEQQLRRSLLACMLWEDSFYEDGTSIAARLFSATLLVAPERAVEIAVEARNQQKLRHAPLMVALALCRDQRSRHVVAGLLERIILRPDELSEFLALYWKAGKVPLAAQVKKGLARAFTYFDEYQLAKYDREHVIKLRDVMFLVHPKPVDTFGNVTHRAKRAAATKHRGATLRHKAGQGALFTRLAERKLETPDTWETALSSGGDKLAHWTRLLEDGRLGALALIRNLRNMETAGVERALVREKLLSANVERVLPFRFLKAAEHAPWAESELEQLMYKGLALGEKLPGRTVLLVDASGSMAGPLSDKSELRRFDAACGLAILLREVCEQVTVIRFARVPEEVPARRGFALREALGQPHGGTFTEDAKRRAEALGYDRIIIITDEQSHQTVSAPALGTKGYLVNVGSGENGIGYGAWTHIDGWSEAVVDFIQEKERMELAASQEER